MSRGFDSLERSLRDGPPDESGYIASPIELGQAVDLDRPPTVGAVERVRRGGYQRQSAFKRRSFPLMTAMAIAVVVAFGGLAVFGTLNRWGAGGQPTPYPSPSPAGSNIVVPPLTETFVSTRNGFSVRYPAGWLVTVATKSWPADIFLPVGNSANDELKQPSEARFVAASQRLEPGQTEDDYLAAWVFLYQGSRSCGTVPLVSPRVTVDGHPGYLVQDGCRAPADSRFSVPDIGYQLIVIADGRAYLFALDGNVDRAYFETMLSTVRLDPASAIDP
jgi:hypothetical protein